MLIAGSIRRECAFSHDIDILVCGPRAALEDFRTWAESFGKDAGEILWSGPEKVSVRGTAMQIDFRLILPEHWGPSLQYFTGSRRHNIMVRATAKRRGLLVNEYGVFTRETGRRVDDNTEGGIYRVVGLKWLPPKYREERGDEHAD
jgi:DNA polymerase (family 10)